MSESVADSCLSHCNIVVQCSESGQKAANEPTLFGHWSEVRLEIKTVESSPLGTDKAKLRRSAITRRVLYPRPADRACG